MDLGCIKTQSLQDERNYMEVWFGHGCPGDRTHSKMNGITVLAWMPWHNRIHSKMNGIMVWAWMPW